MPTDSALLRRSIGPRMAGPRIVIRSRQRPSAARLVRSCSSAGCTHQDIPDTVFRA